MTFLPFQKQLIYIIKVIAGLILVGFFVVLTLDEPFFKITYSFNWLFNIGFFALIFPITYLVYLKMDELQKKLHEHASVFSITFLVSLSGIIGALQANNIVPLFNQVWFVVIGIIVWGVSLAFSDQNYK